MCLYVVRLDYKKVSIQTTVMSWYDTMGGMEMADFRMREKLRKIVSSTTNNEHIPKQSKSIGLYIFIIIVGIGATLTAAVAVGLWKSGHPIVASIVLFIAILLAYSSYQLIRADNIG